jgi:hypothetical protein
MSTKSLLSIPRRPDVPEPRPNTLSPGVALLLFMLPLFDGMAGSGEARAQTTAPTRENGPVWNWREHAPQRDSTRLREEEAGTAPSAQQNNQEANEVDRLYRELIGRDSNAPPQTQRAPRPRTAPP